MSTVTERIIKAHLVSGKMALGEEIAIRIDQTLTQDATGTMACLEFEAMGAPSVHTELSVSYVDHNLLQTDYKNADDHRFLQSFAAGHGIYFSPPGNGICHQVHLEAFGVPGKTLLGSDSHTPTGGGLGMLAIGAGGLDVALAMAGQPFYLVMPEVVGVHLIGRLPDWVSAKDVILELLRRLTVKGGVGKILEYFGPGVQTLSVPDRATIANMGAELGATTSVFPSDAVTKSFLASQGRTAVYRSLRASNAEDFKEIIEVDLGSLTPKIACPSSPDKVRDVSDVEGTPVQQVAIGSCSNSSYRDLMIVAKILEGRKIHPQVSLEINPGSRQVLENVTIAGGLLSLIRAGARMHQSGCLGCIGMGQAPATNTVSLRTFPRNFPGRSGTKNDQVYLVSPETAAAAAIYGKITDPRRLGDYPKIRQPRHFVIENRQLQAPLDPGQSCEIIRGPNIQPFPKFTAIPETWEGQVFLKVGDNITTDHIMPAGSQILPLRSNIPAISRFVYQAVDPGFIARAEQSGEGAVVGGDNYGQGSSREHAALAPRYLGVRIKLAKSFARIHKANLINFGILPLVFENPQDYDRIQSGDRLLLPNLRQRLMAGDERLPLLVNGEECWVRLELSPRHRQIIAAGGLLNMPDGNSPK
ncbi:aconitate hydratase [Desulfobacca acetoxidans]|uniref:Aconitate hydratase n=1 Tax=Desulfobacca acetoxidans (strain ATCC 700848 / DSM 11109 / ASRB2) TaxID=880072 RepID=F2NCV5_DESAR|nr:aconitate hydratase [Desulfobacca acetoxidans]AEB09386.1 aconitate hydratase [Desulfobacca acetoxidans DSM 11109]